jgi:hypothetical protein
MRTGTAFLLVGLFISICALADDEYFFDIKIQSQDFSMLKGTGRSSSGSGQDHSVKLKDVISLHSPPGSPPSCLQKVIEKIKSTLADPGFIAFRKTAESSNQVKSISLGLTFGEKSKSNAPSSCGVYKHVEVSVIARLGDGSIMGNRLISISNEDSISPQILEDEINTSIGAALVQERRLQRRKAREQRASSQTTAP